MMKKAFLSLGLILGITLSHAQIGGQQTFLFTTLAPSARVTAMGGIFISVMDDDPAMAFQNPVLANPSMNNHLSLNTVAYPAGINYGYAGFVHDRPQWKTTFNGGIQYMNYGAFTAADDIGNNMGTFRGNEYNFTLGASRMYTDRFYYGASVNLMTSKLESYSASGGAITFAGAYSDTAADVIATVLFKNVGTQFKSYTSGVNEPLPFDIQAGVSKRFAHTPFLFSLTLHHLYEFDIRYNNPAEITESTVLIDSSQTVKEKHYTADKIFRHAIFGTEIYFGNALRLDIAYNHLRRQELSISTKRGLAGFSFGANVRISKFSIGYGHAIYDVAGSANHFSVTVNMADWFGKKQL